MLGVSGASAQKLAWPTPNRDMQRNTVRKMHPPAAQAQRIRRLLQARMEADGWCEGTDPGSEDDSTRNLTFERVTLGRLPVLLVEAGVGCGRGGQGSNGEMWLFTFHGEQPVLLADPQHGFGGWWHSARAQRSHGMRDIIVGWHDSCCESGLVYFRFNGRGYRSVGSALMTTGNDGYERLVIDK